MPAFATTLRVRDLESLLRLFRAACRRTDSQGSRLHDVIKALLVLNLLDSIFTLVWVHSGFAEEANILLRELVATNAVAFMCVKVALVSLGALLLWRYRKHAVAVAGLMLVFITYVCLFIYHLHFLPLLTS